MCVTLPCAVMFLPLTGDWWSGNMATATIRRRTVLGVEGKLK